MIEASVTKFFFNQKAVTDAVDRARLKILRKAGYETQQQAKKSLIFRPPVRRPRWSKNPKIRKAQQQDYYARKKADAAPPGRPPFLRRRNYPSLASIIYAMNPDTGGVIVGPIERRKRSAAKPMPGVHERGGTVTINVKGREGTRPMVARYKPRPIMGPALDRASSTIPEVVKNSVVGPG